MSGPRLNQRLSSLLKAHCSKSPDFDSKRLGPSAFGSSLLACEVLAYSIKRMKDLEIENQRLSKAVSDLTLEKLILAEVAKGNV